MRINFLNKKIKFDHAYALILFVLLSAVYLPYFSTPPRSDYWQLFYFFHHLNEFPGSAKWLHVLNYDVFSQIRYQPLSHLYYYFLHRLVGSGFILFNISNFLMYFFSAYLLYKFALNFSRDRVLAAIFIGLFAFLFTHFDILLWSYHIYIIAGLSMFIAGFIFYIRFLKTGKLFLLCGVILFFLSGMLCYEPYVLWPLSVIILSSIKYLKTEEVDKKRIIRANWSILGVTYIFYFLFYLFTRSINTYSQPLIEINNLFKLGKYASSVVLVLYSILYNNIIVNIYPLLSFPLKVAENIELGGPIIKIMERKQEIVFLGAIFLGILLFLCLLYLKRKKYFEELKVISFFLFLIFSSTYILFFCRLITNEFAFSLRQFRYLYISNALTSLVAIFVFDKFLRAAKKRKKIVYSALAVIFVLNIYCVHKITHIYGRQFVNLKMMLSNIKLGISSGSINENDKLYIDKDMPDYLPFLSWNIWMGEQFMNGNYQWMFSKKDVRYFSDNIESASWIIDKDEFSVVRKSPENLSKKVIKLNLLKDKDYIDVGKDRRYMDLAYFYRDKGNYGQAGVMFKKAIDLNPNNYEIYFELGYFYREQGRYKEAEEMLKKAIEIRDNSQKR